MGGFLIADGTQAKALSGLDDHSRFCVSARLMPRERTRPVCDGLRTAIGYYGAPEQILTDIQAWWCPEVPGLSGRRCEDRWVRHPPIVVASPIGARRDSLPVDHVGVRGLLPETGHPVRNVATAPNSPRIPVSECLVRLVLMRQWAVDGS